MSRFLHTLTQLLKEESTDESTDESTESRELAHRLLGWICPAYPPDSAEAEHAFYIQLEHPCPPTLPPGLLGTHQRQLWSRVLAAVAIGRCYALHRHLLQRRSLKPSPRSSQKTTGELILEKIHPSLRLECREWIGFVPIFGPGQVGDFCLVEIGARTHVNVDPAEFFGRLLSLRPEGFALFHNHPSGSPVPSSQDIHLTSRMRELAGVFGMQFLGHWIITEEGQISVPTTRSRYQGKFGGLARNGSGTIRSSSESSRSRP